MAQPTPNPYYLSPEAQAALKRRAEEIRTELAWKRAQRQAREAVSQLQGPRP